MARRFFLLFLILFYHLSYAQIPAGYYDNARGKSGETLKNALYLIIKDHTELSYTALWAAFQTTDDKPNGKVWDMYSDKPGQTPPYEFAFGTNQCGNYNSEADCYNREHSFPKSWFNDATPMYTDLFHLYPTDGYVNGKRSNYPFGEVSSPTWTSLNGSKLGNCSYPGYSGVVFEPVDGYKGDFARSYFYMVTRYHNVVAGWSSEMLDGTSFPAFTTWAINMLLEWSKEDPVSQKEIDRNNDIYNQFQHNRNPFIDHPEYADLIWKEGIVPVQFISNPQTTINIGGTYHYEISASGGEGATLNILCLQKPSWLNFTNVSNGLASLAGTPTILDIGNHPIILEVSDGTTSDQQNYTLSVTNPSTYISLNEDDFVKIYPNPVNSIITVEQREKVYSQFDLYNILGVQLINELILENKVSFDLSNLDDGVYLIVLKDKESNIHTTKIIKK